MLATSIFVQTCLKSSTASAQILCARTYTYVFLPCFCFQEGRYLMPKQFISFASRGKWPGRVKIICQLNRVKQLQARILALQDLSGNSIQWYFFAHTNISNIKLFESFLTIQLYNLLVSKSTLQKFFIFF